MIRLATLGALAIATALTFAGAPLKAQVTTVAMHGVIRGSDGSIPADALVEVRSRETAAMRQLKAEENGAYRVLGLAPGSYDLSVRALGYRQHRRENVRLILGQHTTVDFSLERGATELAPVVTEARDLEVRRTDISTAVLQEEIAKLPLNTRNVLNLAAIAPGVRTFAPEGGRSIPNAGALSGLRFVNFYVDGLEWKGTYVGDLPGEPGLGSLIPQEAVREFRIYLNPYDVEYTRGASWVISAITHRGGNVREGSIFSYFQNEPLVAKGTFQSNKPPYKRLQGGGNLRGAVLKNRLFYSLTYEAQRSDNYIDVVPGGPEERPDIWSSYAGTQPAPLRLHSGLLRLTAPFKSHTLDAIWASRHLTNESDFGRTVENVMFSRDAGLALRQRLNSLVLRDTYTSASVVNEFSFHVLDVMRRALPISPGPTFRYPGIQIGRAANPAHFDTRHLRAVNKTSWTRAGPGGSHTFKSGLELNRVRLETYLPTSKDGLFTFDLDTSTRASRAVIGVGVTDPTSTREARDTNRGWIVGAYLQDEWQPVPSISVTAGVRYDAEVNTLNQRRVYPWATDTILRRAYGEAFLNDGDRKNDLNNVAPRLAVTWDVFGTGRTSARAGYGILYDRVPVSGAQTESIGAGWRTYILPSPATTDPADLRRRVASGEGAPNRSMVLLKDRLETPTNRQWSVGVGQRIAERWAVNLDYLDQRLANTYVTVKTNQRSKLTGRRPITESFGDITLWDDFGDARFRALLASARYDGGSARATVAYTLGWAESEFAEFTTSNYPSASFYSMQRSEGDERHRVVLSGFTGLKGGFDLSAVAIVASPHPFLVTTGADDNQNGSENDDWPDGRRTKRRVGWDNWYRTVDLRLSKTFPVRSGAMIVTAEMFNVLNSANHSEYQPKLSLLDYGKPVGDYARRQGQLGVRYQF